MATKLFAGLDISKRKLEVGVVVCVIAIALLVLLPGLKTDKGKQTASEAETAAGYFDAAAEQQQLKTTLRAIRGAGEVDVMITYASTPEKVPAVQTNSQRSLTQEDNANGSRSVENTTDSNNLATEQNQTVVVSEKRPEVLGVVIVADGAADISVQLALQGAAQTALGVSADKVNVYEREAQ